MPDDVIADGYAAEIASGADSYSDTERDLLPAEAVAASLGCGNPIAVAELREGETVLDLGSGGGIDVLLSARRVGTSGMAYGVDMTDEMLTLARSNAAKAGVTNVEFLKGTIEDVPLPDESVDVVISNCVINLSIDKPAVFAETYRVLRPGGRLGDLRRRRRGPPRPRPARGARRLRRLHRRAGKLRRLHRRRAHPHRVPGRADRRRLHRRQRHVDPSGRRRHALSDHQS